MTTIATAIPTRVRILGIDISKLTFDVTLLSGLTGEGIHSQFSNDKKGHKKLLKWLKENDANAADLITCMEATGAYWRRLAKCLYAHGARVYVVNPSRIRGYCKSEQRRSKTDKIDSGVIARFVKAQVDLLHSWEPPHEDVEELQSLTRLRDSFVAERTALKNKLSSGASCAAAKLSIRRVIKSLNEEIRHVERLVQATVLRNEKLREQYKQAIAMKGIGPVVASTILAETRAFVEFVDAGQVTAFAGLDVVEYSSGTSIKGKPRISKTGNRRLRTAMYMAAQSAVRRNPTIKAFYERLLNKGLKKKQALVACARKLLEILFAVIKSGSQYNPHHNLLAA